MSAAAAFRMISVIAMLVAAAMAVASPARAQANFDRVGGDYLRTPVRSGDPADCAMICERDKRCRAWTFSYPTVADGAFCWLKSSVPQRTHSDCCISGVRGAGVLEPHVRGLEISTDRGGGDYRSFDVKGKAGEDQCKTACTGEAKCRAWTYARPGYAGREARCFLKKEIKPPRRRPGFISGVVR
ncbi:MAG: PAN domain-containing protein [Xanthobacteraceae bacterium]